MTIEKTRIKDFYLSKSKAWGYIKTLPTAISSKFVRRKILPASDQIKLVRDFFSSYRDEPNDVDLADHSTGHVDAMVWYFLQNIEEQYKLVVDMGCGNGALRFKLKNKKYIGIDIFISNQSDESSHFIQSNISEADITDLKREPAYFYAINCICYAPRVEDIGKFLQLNSTPGDVLTIIEPMNEFWWEVSFHGIIVTIRSPEALIEYFSKIGFDLHETAYCYIHRLLPFRPFSVFQAHRFKKR